MVSFNARNPFEHYENLQLKPDASLRRKDIKEKYAQLAQIWHPDKNQDENAANQFARITESYKILSDPDRKREYDAWIQSVGRPRSPLTSGGNNDQRQYSPFGTSRDDDERYVDHKAQEYAKMRYQWNARHGRYHAHQHQMPPQYQDPADIRWKKAQQQTQAENDRINALRSQLSADNLKLALAFGAILAYSILTIRFS
ncbi:hypothetical protein MP228_001977 [Amoeboaphelidium protococcarum]|nr:hypothetical protein MP228_001977 [Amoeboaphelidium protococcarum]